MKFPETNKISSFIKDIVYILGLVFIVYSFVGKKAVEKERETQSTIALKNDVKNNNKTDSLIISRLNDLDKGLNNVNQRLDNNSDTNKLMITKINLVMVKQTKTDKGVVELFELTGNIESAVNYLMP